VRGPFDGVVLAAALPPGAVDCPQLTGAASLAAALGYPEWVPGAPPPADADADAGGGGGGGGGAWVGIVTGRLRPSVFNASAEEDVPDCVTVFGGGPLLRVDRVGVAAGPGAAASAGAPPPPPSYVYRIVCWERPAAAAAVVTAAFTDVAAVAAYRLPRPGRRVALVDGPACPAVIVERRWVNAAATDVLGGGVEADVLGAANAASLFGDDVPWK